MEDFTARQIDHYVVEEELGRGGMAIVYRARHVQLDRVCALKLLRPELADDQLFVERFLREARRAAQLEHPHIVPIYDTGSDGRSYFIAMKYLPGHTLRQIMDRGPVEPQLVASYLTQAATALDYAHGRNIVHRDIKPGNMVVDSAGWLTLTDFGLARATDDLQLTMTGTLVGTPNYMAPEQVQGRAATRQTDIYQLGIVAYELLGGAPPFTNRAPYAVLQAHISEQPVALHELSPQLAPELSLVVDKALAKKPEDRYSSASEFVNALTPYLGGADIPPPPIPGAGVIDETDRLYRGAVAADATTAQANFAPVPGTEETSPAVATPEDAAAALAAATAASAAYGSTTLSGETLAVPEGVITPPPGDDSSSGVGPPPAPPPATTGGEPDKPRGFPVFPVAIGAVALVLLCMAAGGAFFLSTIIGDDDDDPTATPAIAAATSTATAGSVDPTATEAAATPTGASSEPTATSGNGGEATPTATRPAVVISTPRPLPPTATTPPEQPTPTPAPVPAQGAVLIETDPVQTWDPGPKSDAVIAEVREDLFYVKMSASTVFLFYDSSQSYGDASTSIDVRLTDPTALSAACVAARFTTDPQANYELCLAGDGESTARYWDGESYVSLFDWDAYPGAVAPTEWNTLEIRARGAELWFLINGTLIGQVTYDGVLDGFPGFQVVSFQDGAAEWAFDNLVVRGLQ